MDSKISIIIPVYNVEQYLAACLDSVINQTMRDIQIICVNDGSTDNSRSILHEYADKDSRIKIIDKTNGGQAAARNSAYTYVKGKYILFVDADDWIELDLCEKVYQKAEESNADIIVFFFFTQYSFYHHLYKTIMPGNKKSLEEKMPLIDLATVCGKLFRTDFLLDNNLYFPEGLMYEDNFINWKAVILAKCIYVLTDQFYHQRDRLGSTTRSAGEHTMHVVPIHNKIREFLFEAGCYTAYREKFLYRKLNACFYQYLKLPKNLKPKFIAMIKDSMTDDDRKYCCTVSEDQLERSGRLFFAMLSGGYVAAVRYYCSRLADVILPHIARVPGVRFAVRKISLFFANA